MCVCVHRPDCWPKEPAELWCCPEQLVSHKQGGGSPSGAAGQLFTHRSKCWHVTQEDRECHTSHTVERSVSHYGTSSRFCQLGFDVQRGRAGGDGVACMACRHHVWSDCWDKGFHIYRKRWKLQPWQWLALCLASVINGLSSSPFAHTPFINPAASPGLLKTLLCRHFFESSSMKLPLIYSYSKSHSNILHKLCS